MKIKKVKDKYVLTKKSDKIGKIELHKTDIQVLYYFIKKELGIKTPSKML